MEDDAAVHLGGEEEEEDEEDAEAQRAMTREFMINATRSQLTTEFYDVEAILNCRCDPENRGKKQYLVKWKGWDADFNTWRPEAELPADLVSHNGRRMSVPSWPGL